MPNMKSLHFDSYSCCIYLFQCLFRIMRNNSLSSFWSIKNGQTIIYFYIILLAKFNLHSSQKNKIFCCVSSKSNLITAKYHLQSDDVKGQVLLELCGNGFYYKLRLNSTIFFVGVIIQLYYTEKENSHKLVHRYVYIHTIVVRC